MKSHGQGPGSLRGLVVSGDPSATLYLRPLVAGDGALLAGGPIRFTDIELIVRDGGRATATPSDIRAWAASQGAAVAAHVAATLARLTAPHRPIAGLTLAGVAPDRPRLMGIVNVTPDSFSDGGDFSDPAAAVAHGRALAAAGADILDVGGESTRPGAVAVTPEAQLARVVPVIEGLAGLGVPVSIDTRSAAVMRAAVAAGAAIINDVSALAHDPQAPAAAADLGVPVILGHLRGDPATMREHAIYGDVTLDVFDELAGRIAACVEAGIARDRLVVDPGFGFAKGWAQNAELLGRLSLLHGLGCAICVGASRKTFAAGGRELAPRDRGPASLAAGLAARDQGVHILRVHDVAGTRAALDGGR